MTHFTTDILIYIPTYLYNHPVGIRSSSGVKSLGRNNYRIRSLSYLSLRFYITKREKQQCDMDTVLKAERGMAASRATGNRNQNLFGSPQSP